MISGAGSLIWDVGRKTMHRNLWVIVASLLLSACATRNSTHNDGYSDLTHVQKMEAYREEIEMMQREITKMQRIMLRPDQDPDYLSQLEAVSRMPPEERDLTHLPTDLGGLKALRDQLKLKYDRWKQLLVIGSAGY